MITIIRRILGYLGLKYCIYCGRRLEYVKTEYRSYYEEVAIYECPHCDHLDRFDMRGFK